MKKRFIAAIMSLVMCASLVLPVGYADVKADVKSAEILDTDVSEASDGCTLLGVYGTYYSQAMEALDKLNEIRKEACEAALSALFFLVLPFFDGTYLSMTPGIISRIFVIPS